MKRNDLVKVVTRHLIQLSMNDKTNPLVFEDKEILWNKIAEEAVDCVLIEQAKEG